MTWDTRVADQVRARPPVVLPPARGEKPVTGRVMWDVGCRMSDVGCRMWDVGCRIGLVVRHAA